jgi:hypothetical protein
VTPLARAVARLRARTLAQLLVAVGIIVVGCCGIAFTIVGERDLGRSLIGLTVVAVGPFTIWLRSGHEIDR